jgi:hypothetical protein
MNCHVIIRKMGWIHASLLVDFKSDFKDIILSHLDELGGLPYMDRKLEISEFNPN